MLYPTLKLVISMQDELLLRDITDPTKLNSVLLRAINTARRGLEQAADLLRRQYADLDNPESHWNNPWTSHDLPGICTHGPKPPRMESLYETGLPLMQADAVAGVLDPNQRTYCVHLRSCREICSYERVHEMAHGPQPGPTTYIDHVHPVPGDTPQRTQDLWLRKLSQDGRTVIVDHSGSTVWETMSLLNNAANEGARDRRRAHALAHHALFLRSKERDFSNPQALAYAMPLARLAALQQLQHQHRNQLKHDPESRIRYALGRTTEVIDRAYNLDRMRLAGINLTADSPYLNYQHFYDRGMAPPTHQEMADAAISDLR